MTFEWMSAAAGSAWGGGDGAGRNSRDFLKVGKSDRENTGSAFLVTAKSENFTEGGEGRRFKALV